MKFFSPPTSRARRTICLAAFALVSCATVPPGGLPVADHRLAERVDAVVARRGLGPDALSVIDNVVRHESGRPPPGAPPLASELLAHPISAADAGRLFYRAVPGTLRRFVEELSEEPARGNGAPDAGASLRDLLDPYLAELAEAQRELRSASRGKIDAAAMLAELDEGLPSPARLLAVKASIDQAALDRATAKFIRATASFVRALRSSRGELRFPEQPMRFESPVGVVSIGTRGNDVHSADAAVIIDPGGDDEYERAPVTDGAISVIIDLGGNDRYLGADVVVHGLAAVVDLSGDDRYIMGGPGLGAVIAGASLLLDLSGDDLYVAENFGEGAAAFGLGAIVDLSGNDTYRLDAGGQGFGLVQGVGLLWDRAGDDHYFAAGLPDAFHRGGRVSFAQGAAHGARTMIGGGFGILRDDAGDDVYEAQMFAQGTGYYYGLGLLWDRVGDDRYRAVRYAQGNGVHEAIGVLRDDSGNDRYDISVGVGQGMGLDLAVGMLVDGQGDDRYRAGGYAQGSATENGIGVLFDGGGADRWDMSADRHAWGRAEWSRGLPSVGMLLYEREQAVFAREGNTVQVSPQSAELGGPLGGEPIAHEQPFARCPAAAAPAGRTAPPLATALLEIEPALIQGDPADPALVAEVESRLATDLEASLAGLPADNFDVILSFGAALRCALAAAPPESASAMWDQMERGLVREPGTPFAGAIAGALLARPGPMPQALRIADALDGHSRCSVQASALMLRAATAADAGSRRATAAAAQAALRSSCWRLQAAALEVLQKQGVAPDRGARLPSFLLE